uniref:Uncharacterized protein n=1 Tax=Rhizophora mucronata TaxID=61149 RepID=A0A2P2MMG4_RHIMU
MELTMYITTDCNRAFNRLQQSKVNYSTFTRFQDDMLLMLYGKENQM